MNFQVGDQVVHWNYGLGKIIQIDEKKLNGRTSQYYVVKIRDLTIWVPVCEADDDRLRLPTPPGEFEALFSILSSPAQPLSDDRMARKMQISDQLKDGKLDSVCRTLRDLTFHCRNRKMNDNDKAVLERTQNFLLSEWTSALSVSVTQASKQLDHLLGEAPSKANEPDHRESAPSAWR